MAKLCQVIAVVVLVAACVLSTSASYDGQFEFGQALAGKNQSRIIGNRAPYDRLLLQETAYKKGSVWPLISSKDIEFPKAGFPKARITCIKVLDQLLNGENGEIKVKSGGVGFDNVLLRFHSLRGKGLHYVVEIYGS